MDNILYAVYYIPVIYFMTRSSYILIPFTYFSQLPTPSSLAVYVYL